MTHTCSHPTCHLSDNDVVLFKEPTCHNDKGWMPVCGKHADMSKDGIEVLLTEAPDLATLASAEILSALK